MAESTTASVATPTQERNGMLLDVKNLRMWFPIQQGVIFHWGGQSLSQMPSPAPGQLLGVSADSPTHAWAVGSYAVPRAHVVRTGVAQGHLAVRSDGGDGVGRGLDTVGDHLVLCAVQFFNAHDADSRTPGPGYFGAHRAEEICQIHDFRFAGCALNDGGAFGQHGSHHYISRAQHRRTGTAAQKHRRTHQALGAGLNVAGLDDHFSPQRLKTF